MFRNRKCEFVSSAFGPNHEGGSKKIRRLQGETERGPEEGKLYKQHFISIYLLKVKSAISALSVSLKGKTFHIWRNVFVSILIGCCSVGAGPWKYGCVQFLALLLFFLPRCKSDYLLWCCKEMTILTVR